MDFYKDKYCDLKIRLGRFRCMEGYEYVKTVSIIDAFADRAYDAYCGVNIPGKFGWGITEEFGWESLFSRALELLEALERGELPLKGRFAELYGSLIDHSFIQEGDTMHVFYNRGWCGYLWDQRFVDSLGHATSKDLINWEIQTPAIAAEPGGHDDYQVWSPAVIKVGDKYYMYYTGVNFNIAQAACLAVSDDLYHWKRYEGGNPRFTPGDWCGWTADKWSDCRDSNILKAMDGRYYMYYCSTKPNENGEGRYPVTGVAVSDDCINWKDAGFIYIPNVPHNCESPFSIIHDGKYFLFFTNCGIGTAFAWSDNPVTGWQVLPDNRNVIFPGGCSEVFEFKGKWYISTASYRGRGEQYLEIFEMIWNDDGSISLGKRLGD